MTTEKNEVWAQGAQPGDAPISSRTVPIPADRLARNAALARLNALNGAATLSAVRQAVLDLRLLLLG